MAPYWALKLNSGNDRQSAYEGLNQLRSLTVFGRFSLPAHRTHERSGLGTHRDIREARRSLFSRIN